MKVLVDINIVLDVILAREPWVLESARLLTQIERGSVKGLVAGHTVTTVFYLVNKSEGHESARRAISELLHMISVVPLGDSDFQRALSLPGRDFEDAVQIAAAIKSGADFIATRNEKDFAGSPVRTVLPGVLLASLA